MSDHFIAVIAMWESYSSEQYTKRILKSRLAGNSICDVLKKCESTVAKHAETHDIRGIQINIANESEIIPALSPAANPLLMEESP